AAPAVVAAAISDGQSKPSVWLYGGFSRRWTRFHVTLTLTGAAKSLGAVAPTNSGPIAISGRGVVETKTWAETSVAASATSAAPSTRPPNARFLSLGGRHMRVIVQSGRCHAARPSPERFHRSHVWRATRQR